MGALRTRFPKFLASYTLGFHSTERLLKFPAPLKKVRCFERAADSTHFSVVEKSSSSRQETHALSPRCLSASFANAFSALAPGFALFDAPQLAC